MDKERAERIKVNGVRLFRRRQIEIAKATG
jgi:hypothetical protein